MLFESAHGQEHSTGASFDLEFYSSQPAIATLARRDASNLPSRVSLEGYCPVPGDQGETGTCTSWSSAYHARTMLESIRVNRTEVSRITAEAFSPSFIYNQIRKEPGCDGGTKVGSALALMKNEGVLKAEVVKFDCEFEDWDSFEKKYSPYKIHSFLSLHDTFANNKVLSVKKALSEHQPVVIGMHIVRSFHEIGNDGIFRPNAEESEIEFSREFFTAGNYSGHAMTVVGYDDSKGTSGSFRIINSWGADWADGGFCWVEYGDFNRFVVQSYSMIDFPVYKEDMKGAFLMETRKGEPMTARYIKNRQAYQLAKHYAAGTQFRIYLKNDEPTYIYAFGFDQTGKTFKLFPHENGVSPYIPYNKAHVPIPDDDHFIEIDDAMGRNDLCVLYSMKELPLDKLLEAIDAQGSEIVAKGVSLRTVVEEQLKKMEHPIVPEEQTVYQAEAFQFTSKRTNETCVPLIMEFGR